MSGTISGVRFGACGPDVSMTIFRGKSLHFELIWGGSSPIDITGWTARLDVRDRHGELMMELSTANGRVENGGANGKLIFTATPEMTRAVDRPGDYELELTTPAGLVHRAISGKVTFAQEVAQ